MYISSTILYRLNYHIAPTAASKRILEAAEAVPCLNPLHKLARVSSGPERSVWFACVEPESGQLRPVDMIDRFLASFPPAKASCSDVAWIGVAGAADLHLRRASGASAGSQADRSPAYHGTGDEEALLRAWARSTDPTRRSFKEPSEALIDVSACVGPRAVALLADVNACVVTCAGWSRMRERVRACLGNNAI